MIFQLLLLEYCIVTLKLYDGLIDRFLVILISLSAALLFPFLASLLKAGFLNVFIFKLALTVTSKNTRQYQRKLFLF